MALKAAEAGGTMPTVFNAANERAVSLFLQKKIRFLQIYELIAGCMSKHRIVNNPSVNEILEAEAQTYDFIKQLTGDAQL